MTVGFLKNIVLSGALAYPNTRAKALSNREGESSEPAKPSTAAPPAPWSASVTRPSSMPDTAWVKSMRLRSVTAKPVGSTEAMRLPDTTKGTVPFTVTPEIVLKVRFWLPANTFTVSPAPSMLIAPVMNEPGSSVSTAGSQPQESANWMAVPPDALMTPELTSRLVP